MWVEALIIPWHVTGLQEELAAAQQQLADVASWREALEAKDAELATLQARLAEFRMDYCDGSAATCLF